MACLGGDGVILHASNLFKGAVPPVVSFNLGSLGFLTSHPVSLSTCFCFLTICRNTLFSVDSFLIVLFFSIIV